MMENFLEAQYSEVALVQTQIWNPSHDTPWTLENLGKTLNYQSFIYGSSLKIDQGP